MNKINTVSVPAIIKVSSYGDDGMTFVKTGKATISLQDIVACAPVTSTVYMVILRPSPIVLHTNDEGAELINDMLRWAAST